MWSLVTSLFKKVIPVFKSAMPLILAAIFVLTLVAIWWAGPWLVINEKQPLGSIVARLAVSTIFVLATGAVWGLAQYRKLRGFTSQMAREQEMNEDPTKLLIERQEQHLNSVMKSMKESLNTYDYLYAQPWFLVLGVENAGKTSLINRSGQKFAFSSVMRASGRTAENPYSVDWWIGDDAVLIDPDGELLTQKGADGSDGDAERRLWMHFVEWLESTRSRRPLNGVVLALDIASLVTDPVSERKAYASLIRARLRELMETLSTRLPVYIALTKLDLLLGFEPFFRPFTQAQRDEILGFTFTLKSVEDLDSWLDEFDKGYGGFVSRINAHLPRALVQCRDKEQRSAIYSFSRQIAGAHSVLREFFVDALASDQFSTSALVRGVYFTSVYQQGVPIDAYVDGASRRYGLMESINSAQKSENSTTYFSNSLFHKIIYPEAGLASDNFRVAKQKRRITALSVVACSLASFLLVGSWQKFYEQNNAQADAVLAKVNKYNELIDSTSFDPLARNIIPPLNTIRSATLEFGFFRDSPKYVTNLGLYQGHTIGPMVEETYLNLLAYRYLPILLRQVALDMAEQPEGSDAKLSVLRVFRMLADKSGRRDSFVREYFSDAWQQAYEGNRDLQKQLMEHLDYALQHTDLELARKQGSDEAIEVLEPYDEMIANVQHEMNMLPIEQRVYRYLRSSSTNELGPPLDLRVILGPSSELVFDIYENEEDDSTEIPTLLTKRGFEQFFIPKSDSIAELALIDGWVLGQAKGIDYSDADKAVLRKKIVAQYVSDYNASWRQGLNAFEMKSFEDINQAVQVLDSFAINYRPLDRLLGELEDNTHLFPEMPENLEARDELMKSPQYRIAAAIDSDFVELNNMLELREGQPTYMDELMESVAQLHTYLRNIQNSPNIGKAALQAVQERMNMTGGDPLYALDLIAQELPKPLDSMIQKISIESWKVVMQSAIKHLEVRWYNEVYREFTQNLMTRYPFTPHATKQVSIDDFERFFGPQGVLDTFYEEQMKVFLGDHMDEFHNVISEDDEGLVRREVLETIARAKQIQKAFFNLKGNLDVQFNLEPLQMSPNKRRSVLNIDGQYVEYSHGPRRAVELVWPNTLRESAETRLVMAPTEVNKSPRSLSYEGPWAFFKLIDDARITGSSATSVDYQFEVDGGTMSYRIHTEDSVNPFTMNLLSNYRVPKTLY